MRRFGLLFLCACGSSSQPAPKPVLAPELASTAPLPVEKPAAPPPLSSDPRIAKTLKKVSAVRALSPKNPVPGVTLPREELLTRVKEHVAREVPHQAIVDEGLVYQLLGELPTQFDYEKAMFDLLEAQLAGYYEPADGTMYMAKDLEGVMADMTLAHELVHALQDQSFDLKSKSKYMAGQSDQQTAISALAEGDATSAMIDVALEGKGNATAIPPGVFAKLVRESVTGENTGNAPRVMSASLVAPYVDGTAFVNELRKQGGWPKVDEAWRNIPVSTEQILHLDKWAAHEPPLAVPAPTGAALGKGWTAGQPDTLGELTFRTVLEEWMPPERAQAVAANWGGDKSALFHNGDASAFAWRLRYDAGSPDDTFASMAFTAISKSLPKTSSSASSASKDASFFCVVRADRGPLAIARKGRDVVIVAGPAKTPPKAAWTSAGDCSLVWAWTAEILK